MRTSQKILIRLRKLMGKIRHRQLMLALSVLIGMLAGAAAGLLKNLTHFVEYKSKSWLLGDHSSELYFLLPTAGVLVTMLFVKYLLKQDIGHGISKILFSISKRKGHLNPHNTWSSMVASSLTVGLGGSVSCPIPLRV